MSNESGCRCGCGTASNEGLTIGSAPKEENVSKNDITLNIDGMTCGHCVSSVTEELSAVPGVSKVAVDLSDGGTSIATITTDAAIEDSVLEAAVVEAGYSLVSVNA